MADGSFHGGEALQKYLDNIAKNLTKGDALKVGFLENATYPDGTPVAMVAAVNEFGGTIEIPERTQDLHFKYNDRTDEISHRFARKDKSNFVQTVTIPAHKITVPPRPYFRNMITAKSPAWGSEMSRLMRANEYDAGVTLAQMGERIKGQLQQSIVDLKDPPNKASTLRQKAGSNPLVDTGHMLNSVDYEVGEE
ncbi:hypothetical protein HX776_24405 [Pseudomonas agarici]|uniref:hypothetical protein n=1 Tax=Pseudomonas agarici TaxID=46677 RepID=UPI0002EB755D|nr:hypothetical protein [Pseudomonas agarici]NWC11933.1 hypothetical protein [Pseudomonas agarici]SEL85577.1 hypothetical protein SAMN05216604_14020 [Pseudomonas agarici]